MKNKTKALLEQDKRIFSINDLSILWNIDNKNTLRTTVKRYNRKGILYRIWRGLYATVPLYKLDKYELACAVSGSYSYISMESVLIQEGIITQAIPTITVLGKRNKRISINGVEIYCRYLNPKFLLNRLGIIENERYAIATAERAVCDIQYISPKYYFDNNLFLETKESEINHLKYQIGYK